MSTLKLLWMAGLGILLAPTLCVAAGEADRAHEATFTHSMGTVTSGRVEGACESRGALFRPGAGTFAFQAREARLEHYVLDENYTIVDRSNEGGLKILGNMDHRREDLAVPSGRGSVSWNGTETAMVFGPGWPYGTRPPFHATYRTDFVQSSPPMPVYAGTFLFPKHEKNAVREREYIVVDPKGVNGTNVVLRMASGQIQIEGNVSVYLEGGRIDGAHGFSFEPRPFRGYVSKYETEHVGYYHERRQHSVLRLVDASLTLEAAKADLVCRQNAGRLEGSLIAYNARGEARAGNETVTFDRQELLLQGAMEFEQVVDPGEEPNSRFARFGARGQFTAVGIDFADAGIVSRHAPSLAEVGVWTLIVAAVAGALTYAVKASGAFYTRLEKPALLDQASRSLVVETLRATPWLNIAALQRSTGLGRSTVRYQLGVLTEHGIVTSQRTSWGPRFAVRQEGVPLPAPPTSDLDDLIRREVGSVPMRLSALMRLVQREQALTRSGAWHVIQKRIEDGRLVAERRASGVWVRCP